MPSFESPIGNRVLSSQAMKELDIPDESQFNQENVVNPVYRRRQAMPNLDDASIQNMQAKLHLEAQADPAELEKEFHEARKAKVTGREKISSGAKRRLEMLLGMTRTTHTVDIGGNIFTMQTIPAKYMREALVAISEFDGTVQAPFEARRQFLARSLIQVAGVEFSQFINSDTIEDKLSFLDELDESLLNRLYSEYLFMTEQAKEKYAIKSEIEAKEVFDDLKK
jgi:hypothetical protein